MALWRDRQANTDEFSWYNKGRVIALAVARALHSLSCNRLLHRRAVCILRQQRQAGQHLHVHSSGPSISLRNDLRGAFVLRVLGSC